MDKRWLSVRPSKRKALRALPAVALIAAVTGLMLVPATSAVAAPPNPNPALTDLSVVKTGSNGTGTVAGGGINCGGTCLASAVGPQVVVLTAAPDPGSYFAGFTTDGIAGITAPANTLTLNLPAGSAGDTLVTAVFKLINLHVDRTGPLGATGTVTSNPAGISCPGDCDHAPTLAQAMVLTATPSPGSFFTGWNVSGEATNVVQSVHPSGGTLSMILPGVTETLVTANFHPIGFPGFPNGVGNLHVTKNGTGAGTVASSNIGGINCGTDCDEIYPWSTSVTLTATPNPGSSFAAWTVSGGATNVSINGNQVTFNVNWPFWDWNTWPWWNNPNFGWNTLVTATFNLLPAATTTTPAVAAPALLDPRCADPTVLCGNNRRNNLVAYEGIVTILGFGGKDLMIGNGLPNIIEGGRGRDYIDGRGAADFCLGGSGRNTIVNC